MNTQVLNLILQIVMAIGILSIVVLLIMPVFKAFHGNAKLDQSRSVLEISDSLAGNQRLTIARANNLLEQNSTALIEVVAVGMGVSLLLPTTPYEQEILSLINKGVVFKACQRSLQQLMPKTGRPVEVLAGVGIVQDGHAYAEGLKDKGYTDEFV